MSVDCFLVRVSLDAGHKSNITHEIVQIESDLYELQSPYSQGSRGISGIDIFLSNLS